MLFINPLKEEELQNNHAGKDNEKAIPTKKIP
jgi:hypothetical protein